MRYCLFPDGTVYHRWYASAFRTPPSGFGISTLTGDGVYFPLSIRFQFCCMFLRYGRLSSIIIHQYLPLPLSASFLYACLDYLAQYQASKVVWPCTVFLSIRLNDLLMLSHTLQHRTISFCEQPLLVFSVSNQSFLFPYTYSSTLY